MWLFEEDKNQMAAARLHGWRARPFDARAPDAPDAATPRRERDRRPLPPGTPSRTFCLLGGPLPDLLFGEDLPAFVASAALLEAMRLPPGAAEVLPVALFSDDPAAHARGYRLVRVLASAPCMDRDRSEWEEVGFTDRSTGRPDRSLVVRRFVLDARVAPPADLFWAEEEPRLLVATEALAARVLDAAGLTGPAFLDPSDLDEWGRPARRRVRGGGLAPYAEEPVGVRPVRPASERPAYVPDAELPDALRPVEAAVRHRLPPDYVRLMLKPPSGLLACDGCRYDLVTDPARVAELNAQVREDPSVTFLREGAPWPDDWLVVGEDGCGNYYALDLGAPLSPVLLYDHDVANGDAKIAEIGLANHAVETARRYLGGDAAHAHEGADWEVAEAERRALWAKDDPPAA